MRENRETRDVYISYQRDHVVGFNTTNRLTDNLAGGATDGA